MYQAMGIGRSDADARSDFVHNNVMPSNAPAVLPIGYRHEDAAVNDFERQREPVEGNVGFVGFRDQRIINTANKP